MELDVGYRFSDGTSILDSLIRLHLIIWVLKGRKFSRLWSQQELHLQRCKTPGFENGGRDQESWMCIVSRGWQKLASRSWERQKQRVSVGPSEKRNALWFYCSWNLSLTSDENSEIIYLCGLKSIRPKAPPQKTGVAGEEEQGRWGSVRNHDLEIDVCECVQDPSMLQTTARDTLSWQRSRKDTKR